MALRFWAWLRGKRSGELKEVSCSELMDAAAEYTLRKLSFDICVDMIANAVGRCEFRTFQGGREIRGREYWLWNYEPNPNQNSSAFLHKLIDHLYRHNEALLIVEKKRGGDEVLAVADAWEQSDQQVLRENEYKKVRVEQLEFKRTFRESDVIRLKLNQVSIEPVLGAMAESWARMLDIAMRHYRWDHGQHWKAHINQLASGKDSFSAEFAQMVNEQLKPFFNSDSAVLPEWDGYEYERVDGGSRSGETSRDLRDMAEDIFDFTARGFLIPAVLVNGKVEATEDANNRFLTYVIDPLCDQLQEEITRKRYGFDGWNSGDFLRVDSSSILHYDLFGQAANVEKLIGSGVYSINDILRAAGQAPINAPWADQHFLTKNFELLEDAAAPLDQNEGGDTE